MESGTIERQSVETFEIVKDIQIQAPIEIAFEAMLDQLGPEGQMPGGKPFPMTIEPWPGGRWYRDLGDKSGHLWGNVQVIKPPTLLEIFGPLMISNASVNHLQYRFKFESGVTHLAFLHRGMGLFPSGHRDGLNQGWGYWIERIAELAERKHRKGT